jgi:hypothetical protein
VLFSKNIKKKKKIIIIWNGFVKNVARRILRIEMSVKDAMVRLLI